jgi:hypothetical protein
MENLASDRGGLEWRQLVDEALAEVDPMKLKGKIANAEEAISHRLQALGPHFDGEERRTLQDASSVLVALKKHVLQPDLSTRREQHSVRPESDQRKESIE